MASTTPALSPNIVVVLVDDMGFSDWGCFGGEGKTPEFDRMAAEGLRFRDFYVNAPICSPSRAALATGQYPQRWRITSYLETRAANQVRGMAQWLDPQAPMMARAFQKAGYATGHFGKWHLGGQRNVDDAPLPDSYGFDRTLVNFEGLGPRVLPMCDAYDGKPAKKHDLGSGELGHGPVRWENRSIVTSVYIEEALTFIDDAVKKNRPFFINVWPDDVHSPYFPPQELRATAKGKRAFYLATLAAMDRQFAPLFNRLRADEALRTNTLVVMFSDNGPEAGAGSAAPFRAGKGMLFEGGIRSPLIVWGPGLLAQASAGTTNMSSYFASFDLTRSFYALANVPLPTNVTLDGEEVSATLLGHSSASRKAPIFWRRPPDRPEVDGQRNPDLAVRDGAWKAYVDMDGRGEQLYDVVTDPGESSNLASAQPALMETLKQAMLAWNAGLPTDASRRRAQKAGE